MKIFTCAVLLLLTVQSQAHQLDTSFYPFDFKKFFEANGVNFPPGARIKYVEGVKRLVVTANPRDHEKIAAILGHKVEKDPAKEIKKRTFTVETSFRNIKTNDLLSCPKIAFHENSSATIQTKNKNGTGMTLEVKAVAVTVKGKEYIRMVGKIVHSKEGDAPIIKNPVQLEDKDYVFQAVSSESINYSYFTTDGKKTSMVYKLQDGEYEVEMTVKEIVRKEKTP